MELPLKGTPIWLYTKEVGTNRSLGLPQIIEGDLGKNYNLQAPVFEGYVVDHVNGSLKGHFTEDTQKIEIFYRAGEIAQIEQLEHYQVKILSETPTYAHPDTTQAPLDDLLTPGTTWPIVTRLATTKGVFWHQLIDSRWVLYDRKMMSIEKAPNAEEISKTEPQYRVSQVPVPDSSQYDWTPTEIEQAGRLTAEQDDQQVTVYSKPYGGKVNELNQNLTVLLTQVLEDPSGKTWYEIGGHGWIEAENVEHLTDDKGE
ncbi:hypothetical protein IV73_GL000377 [Weissella kandleri]|uniref:MucBP domain-containing protein n=1 Tax=Weissella kandleri TaxID=1616 RepID=A0A0R2JH85_9LACO|nr:MucBP domain-containing protein [Weissella kandleri]KRN75222.1 hypothetical protein IV73_GL000377 [Weissella kandleri]